MLCRSSVANVRSVPNSGGRVPTARTLHERHCQDLQAEQRVGYTNKPEEFGARMMQQGLTV